MSLLLVYIHWQEEIILLLPGGVNTHIDELQSASQILVATQFSKRKGTNIIDRAHTYGAKLTQKTIILIVITGNIAILFPIAREVWQNLAIISHPELLKRSSNSPPPHPKGITQV